MSERPNNMGASVFEHVRRDAKKRGRDVQAEAQSYAIRRFIARLMEVDREGRTSVKGGQALGILFGNDRRPTKDLDLSINSQGIEDHDAWVRKLIESACAAGDDGVAFKADDIQIEHRVHQGSGGYRIKIKSSVHTCRTDFVVDVGMTDSLKFKPLVVPLAEKHPHAPEPTMIRVTPVEDSFSEKLLSKIEDGGANIRHKDFYDMWNIHQIAMRYGDLGYMYATSLDLSDEQLAWRDDVKATVQGGDLSSLPEVDITDDCLTMFAYALYRSSLARRTPIPDDIMGFLRSQFAEDTYQAGQYANWIKNQRQRLVVLPPGSDDKNAALGYVLDELEEFIEKVSERARQLADNYGDNPPEPGSELRIAMS
jgi:predicted nucleotidyltransferase component of viral defense system